MYTSNLKNELKKYIKNVSHFLLYLWTGALNDWSETVELINIIFLYLKDKEFDLLIIQCTNDGMQ